jgi:hypothetical protein
MKTKTSILCLLFVSVNALSSAAYTTGDAVPTKLSQRPVQKVEDVFGTFLVHRERNLGVTLNWTALSNQISGYVIQKSYDGEYFDNVDLPVSTFGRWSRAKDRDVYPGYIYYRIVAIMNDGTECCSPVQVLHIVKRR